VTSGHLRSDRRGVWTAARTHTPCGGSRPDVGTGPPGRGLWTALRAPMPGGGSVPHRGTRQRRVRVPRVRVPRVRVPCALGHRTRRRRVRFSAAAIGRPGRRGWRVVGAVAVLAGCLALVGCQGVAGGPQEGEAAPTRAAVGRVGGGQPVSIAIAAAGVDARVVPVGFRADRTMEVPETDLAGWYEPGPRPGEAGPAVIVGHVDSRRGPVVFFRLGELRRGDRIVVGLQDGAARSFLVERVERRPKTALPTRRIWNRTRRPVLRLITCGAASTVPPGTTATTSSSMPGPLVDTVI
jgi:hypothetical protein